MNPIERSKKFMTKQISSSRQTSNVSDTLDKKKEGVTEKDKEEIMSTMNLEDKKRFQYNSCLYYFISLSYYLLLCCPNLCPLKIFNSTNSIYFL